MELLGHCAPSVRTRLSYVSNPGVLKHLIVLNVLASANSGIWPLGRRTSRSSGRGTSNCHRQVEAPSERQQRDTTARPQSLFVPHTVRH
eukprot:8573360-Alexandrium_andersonii.AAC.1